MSADKLRLVVVGGAGRMGRQIISDALQDEDFILTGAVDAVWSGSVPPPPELVSAGVRCLGMDEALSDADVVIDFSIASATLENLDSFVQYGKPCVIGTTGFDVMGKASLLRASQSIPLLWSPNMSVGANLLTMLLARVSRVLGEGFDVEVIETHHRGKRDAPSGTALAMVEALSASSPTGPKALVFGRRGQALRTANEIGVHAVRGGGNPGEHCVLFASDGEEFRLSHRVLDRRGYSLGALRAAKFVARQAPGFYDMGSVLTEVMSEEA